MSNNHNSNGSGASAGFNGSSWEPAERTKVDVAHLVEEVFQKAPKAPLHPESLVPRLGDYLVEMGELSPRGLSHALEVQRQREQENRPVLLGHLLVELGYIEKETLDQAVTMQVMALQRALAAQNQQLEKKVAERTEQLEQALEQARRLQQHKDEFIGAISHELRTPLTLIMGYLDLFLVGEMGQLSPSQAKAFDKMMQAAERLRELVGNLLDFGNGSARLTPTSYAPVPVSDLFHFALRRNLAAARERDIQLLVDAPQPPGLAVRAEGKRIRWVISELVDNAVKFNEPHGKVKVLGRKYDEQQFFFLVEDNGPGIPSERLDEVFEPFRQLDGSLTRKAGGMGLGLTLARQIVEAHGSRLEIRSRPGQGTQVGFTLPLAT